jgi:hypothetical protein
MASGEDNKDYLNKALAGADFGPGAETEGARRALRTLAEHPGAFARAEPPLGYEAQLLASLRAKLPPAKAATAQPAAKSAAAKSAPTRARGSVLAWALAGGFAALAVGVFLRSERPRGGAPELAAARSGGDGAAYLAAEARKGDAGSADAWLASMSDRAGQQRVARADIGTAAEDLANVQDRRKVDEVLRRVARQMGME